MGADALEVPQDGLNARPAPEGIRAFVAIGIPESNRAVLAGYLGRCARLAPDFRWVPPDNLHLTVRFLGNLSPGRLADVAEGLRQVRFQPFQVRLGAVGEFSRGSLVRVAWIGVATGVLELAALARQTDAACRAAGLAPEVRAFNPHLTLARARDRRGGLLPPLPAAPELTGWTVASFCLHRSRTGPGGAVYSVLEEFSA